MENPLLDLTLAALFARRYNYSAPSERELCIALKRYGIADPVAAMEAWRTANALETPGELADRHNAHLS